MDQGSNAVLRDYAEQLNRKDTIILDLCAALSEIMEKTGDTETVFYIAQDALKAVYPEPDNMEAVWGGWV